MQIANPRQVRNSRGLRGCPSHQGVFPAFTHVKLNLPAPHAIRARLHSVTGRHADADSACFDVLLRDTRNWRDVHLKIQTMSIFAQFGQHLGLYYPHLRKHAMGNVLVLLLLLTTLILKKLLLKHHSTILTKMIPLANDVLHIYILYTINPAVI